MQDLDLTTLRLFVYVCETGSISRAAERASIVASAISKRIGQLEERLGTPLVARKGYGVVPTTAGQTLLEHARAMLDQAARIELDLRDLVAGARGQVRLLAAVSAISESLGEDVASFLAKPAHRTIQVDLEEQRTPEVVRGVREGMASLGVCWDATDLSGLQTRPHSVDHFCVAVPKRHPLASRRRVRFADTLDYEQVGLPVNSATRLLLDRAAASVGRTLRHRVIVSSFETALSVVRARATISVAPREIAEPLANDYGLKLLTLDEPWARRRWVICFRNVQMLTPAAQLLLNHLASAHASQTKHS